MLWDLHALTDPHDRNRQLNCSCPLTCGSYIWRSDIGGRNVNLLQTEGGFIAGAKRHSMKGFLYFSACLAYSLDIILRPYSTKHQTITLAHSRGAAMIWLFGWSHTSPWDKTKARMQVGYRSREENHNIGIYKRSKWEYLSVFLMLRCEWKDLGDDMPCGGPPSASGKVP